MSKFARITWEDPKFRASPTRGIQPRPLMELVRRTRVPRAPEEHRSTPRSEAIYLLQAASEVEHQFVVQYLYAMWSLQGDPNGWRSQLRQIAVEEMGHLITVQNLLVLLGGSPYLRRESIPPAEALPFDLELEPFGKRFVSRFLVAESPIDAELPEDLQGLKKVTDHVGVLYLMLYWLFQSGDDPEGPWQLPPDLGFPAGWHVGSEEMLPPDIASRRLSGREDWTLELDPGEPPPLGRPGLHILPRGPFASTQAVRDTALQAIGDVAVQGEGPGSREEGDSAHYLLLQRMYQTLASEPPPPTLKVPHNPHTVRKDPLVDPEDEPGFITHPTALQWAALFNLRYRMLLLDILHVGVTEDPNLRLQLGRSWAVSLEMFLGMRGSQTRLVALPLKASQPEPDSLRAAPSFELAGPPLPETATPADALQLWRLHLELIDQAAPLIEALRPATNTLRSRDAQRRTFIEQQLGQS